MNLEENKRADLYIRVSTDEQADKGYSQRNQEEMLRKYCDNNWIEVRKIIYEDHSAKSFNRPAWKKYLASLKKNNGETSVVLFTKWDRFSRNAGDAYQMISILRGFGVEPQAIEQPLDLSIPENKMMLAFYLAAPEVENDRRALNVFYGMRRAKKEGRYMGLAPIGYSNRSDERGCKYIEPKEPDSQIIRWIFEELSKGVFSTEQVWKKSREKGLQCSKSAFWQVIRNPLYCGRIFLAGFKDEESRFVTGQHRPIVSEKLFDCVQEVLDGRGRTYASKFRTREEFILRGFVICPICGRSLTASTSRGRSKYYSYYHCVKGCTYRIGAEELNEAFKKILGQRRPRPLFLDIYRKLIAESYYDLTYSSQIEKKRLLQQQKELEKRIAQIRDLLATQKIDPLEYLEIKNQYHSRFEELSAELKELQNSIPPVEPLLEQDLTELMLLDRAFDAASTEDKRLLIQFMYPEKILFYGTTISEDKTVEIVSILYAHPKEVGKASQ